MNNRYKHAPKSLHIYIYKRISQRAIGTTIYNSTIGVLFILVSSLDLVIIQHGRRRIQLRS